MADVVEINSIDQLEPYRLAWNALLPGTPKASFFHTFDWLKLYWKHYGETQKLRVLLVRSHGDIIGIVPFCVSRERYHVGSVRVLTYPLSDWGMWYGPIGSNQAATLHMAIQHLSMTRRDWDMIDLRWMNASSEQHSATQQACKTVHWKPDQTPYQQGVLIRTAEANYEDYLGSRSKKLRHEIRRQQRVLNRAGNITFQRHRPASLVEGDGEPRWDIYEECLRISQKAGREILPRVIHFATQTSNSSSKKAML